MSEIFFAEAGEAFWNQALNRLFENIRGFVL